MCPPAAGKTESAGRPAAAVGKAAKGAEGPICGFQDRIKDSGVPPSVAGSTLAEAQLPCKASQNSADIGTVGVIAIHQLMSSAVVTQVSRILIASSRWGR